MKLDDKTQAAFDKAIATATASERKRILAIVKGKQAAYKEAGVKTNVVAMKELAESIKAPF